MKVDNSKRKTYRRISVLVIVTAVLIPSLFSYNKKYLNPYRKASTNLAFEKIEVKFENIYSKELETQI